MALMDQFKKRLEAWVAGEEEELEPDAPPRPKPPARPSDEAVVPRAVPGQADLPAYSGGFEQIYAYENIDPKSVRPMGGPREEPSASVTTMQVTELAAICEEEEPVEPEFDLGRAFRGWMPSFCLKEPIEVLGLTQMALKALLDQERRTISDLLDARTETVVHLEGMGQGHIDEIHQKLQRYIGSRSVFRCRRVDFDGLLRGIFSGVHPKKVYLLLEEYNLQFLYPLNAAEEVEVRHLSPESRREAVAAAVREVVTEQRSKRLREALKEVADVFLKPWLRGRLGLGSETELMERAERIGEDPKDAARVLQVLSDLFFDGAFPFSEFLLSPEPGVFCSDYAIKKRYIALMQRIDPYFYGRGLHYPLTDLVSLVGREQARRWDGERDGFIEEAMRLSPRYRVRKGARGHLTIRRS